MLDPASILIVEDSPPMRQLLSAYFTREEDIVLLGIAETGEELRVLLDDHQPDAIVLDLGLPDSRGLDLLLHIQAVSPVTGVIVFSGNDVSRRGGAMTMLGADAFIEKPDVQKLHRTIVEVVAQRRLGIRPR